MMKNCHTNRTCYISLFSNCSFNFMTPISFLTLAVLFPLKHPYEFIPLVSTTMIYTDYMKYSVSHLVTSGFRPWRMQSFFADRLRVGPNFTVFFKARAAWWSRVWCQATEYVLWRRLVIWIYSMWHSTSEFSTPKCWFRNAGISWNLMTSSGHVFPPHSRWELPVILSPPCFCWSLRWARV